MRHYLIASFLAFSLVVAPTTALAASSQSSGDRYFVQSTKSFWRYALGARNVFPDGFTADLSDLQLKGAHLAGLKLVKVKKFNILDDVSVTPDSSPAPTPLTMQPAETIPWGIAFMLNNQGLMTQNAGKDVTVAILDTGIDREHPDLKDRIVKCADYADLSKALVKDTCDDVNGHGTHMAGIIAADGGPDGAGIWGLAPQVNLLIYKVCSGTGACMSDDIAKAITAAVDARANIIVLGLGGESSSSFIDDALAYATDHGVLIIAAAGNDGPYEDSVDSPASDPQVIAVGALASGSAAAEFSSRGTNETTKAYHADSGDIELAAPGVNIESTFKDGGYAILSGTSMAASHIAGLAARIWQTDAKHPAEATRLLLHEIVHDIAPVGDDDATGWGVPTY